MATISHEPLTRVERRSPLLALLGATEVWASLAIVVIWLAVLFTAVYGPDITNHTAGGDASTVPSAVAVALFASIATWAVAKYGFGHDKRSR